MDSRPLAGSNDEGETLIELILAAAIMGIAIVAIVGGIATSILMSDVHRKQATAGSYLRSSAENLQGAYAWCVAGKPPDYASLLATQPSGFDPPTTTVKFWDGASFSKSSCPATDPGLQQVTLTLGSTDARAAESLVVVVRKS